MNIPRWLKPFIAVAVVWPIFYFVAFFMLIATQAFASPGVMPILFLVHGLTALMMLGTLGISIAHAVLSKTLSNEWKIVWSILLLFGAIIAVPIYFFVHIWPEPASSRRVP